MALFLCVSFAGYSHPFQVANIVYDNVFALVGLLSALNQLVSQLVLIYFHGKLKTQAEVNKE